MRLFEEAKSPTSPNLAAEIKNFLNEDGVSDIVAKVRKNGAEVAKSIIKVFITYIYGQGSKKQETALSIAYELQGLRLELMKPNLNDDPLREKFPYPISLVYEQVCSEFKLNSIKINSNRSAIRPPEQSVFLPKLFSTKYGLQALSGLLIKKPRPELRDHSFK